MPHPLFRKVRSPNLSPGVRVYVNGKPGSIVQTEKAHGRTPKVYVVKLDDGTRLADMRRGDFELRGDDDARRADVHPVKDDHGKVTGYQVVGHHGGGATSARTFDTQAEAEAFARRWLKGE